VKYLYKFQQLGPCVSRYGFIVPDLKFVELKMRNK